ANVVLVGPPTLVPKTLERIVKQEPERGEVVVSHNLDEVIGELDAIIMLRVQFERHGGDSAKSGGMIAIGAGAAIASDYKTMFGLTAERAKRLAKGVPVLHPGPINLGLEIDADVADDEDRSVILQQVTNGVAVRMAVVKSLLGGGG
ncbi:MAG TPA: hypothetical protein VG711_03845, partial [Phycisphaerales bacterium]|nr:hypothetical protein [Phycisphaerales bacterium]